MNFERAIAEKLLQIKAIKLSPQNPFTWTSGIKSPIYCDNRVTLSYPEVRNLILDGFVQRMKQLEGVNTIGAVATAGIPHGAILSHVLSLPFVYVRDKPKAHGRQNIIEGELQPNARILLIEDLISTGKSSIAAAESLKEAGAEVVEVLSIFNYGLESAHEAFEQSGFAFSSLSHFDILIEVASETGFIQSSELKLLQSWKKDPHLYQV